MRAVEESLLLPSDPHWQEALFARVFNGRRPGREPEAILIARSPADVQRGVRAAAERGWTVAVRSGGHSLPVWSLREGGLLIDLGVLNGIEYDDRSGVVAVGPATLGGAELMPFLAERGRFFGAGHCSSVGLGGFLLSGGQGWNQRGWGWAAEAVVAVDVVTADGELLRADAQQHTDLYWAARGAGPGFPGVVVRFHLATRPAPGHVAESTQLYALADYEPVMEWLYAVHDRISPDVELGIDAVTVELPSGEHERVLAVTALALATDRAEAERALAPLRVNPVIGRALSIADCRETSLPEQYAWVDAHNPPGARYVSDSRWVAGEPVEVIAALRPLLTTTPSPGVVVAWRSNAPVRELPDMALSLQSEAYVAAYLVYDDPADDELHRAWLQHALAAAAPVTVGQYVGDADRPDQGALPFLSPQSWERLRQITAARDPDGRFAGYHQSSLRVATRYQEDR